MSFGFLVVKEGTILRFELLVVEIVAVSSEEEASEERN